MAATKEAPQVTRNTSSTDASQKAKRPSLAAQLQGSLSANLAMHRQNIEGEGSRETENWTARHIDLLLIDPNRYQPRKTFEGIEELAQLIDEQGLLQPIEVRPMGNRYEIVSGERRVRAHKLLGKTRIMAHVVHITEQESSARALVENLGRQDLSDYEKSRAMIRHRKEFGSTSTTHQEWGLTSSTYYRFLAFENLPEAVNTLLDKKPALVTAAAVERTVKVINEQVEAGTPKEALEKALINIIQTAISAGTPIKNLALTLERKFITATGQATGTEIKSGDTKLGQSKKSKKFYELKLVRSEFTDEQLKQIEEFLLSLKTA